MESIELSTVDKGTLANLVLGGITTDAQKEVLRGLTPDSYDNVFIMYHKKSDNFPLMVKPNYWPSLQTSGEIAEGVVVVDGDKLLVVAPTEASKKWSSAAVSGGGYTTTDRKAAYNDFAGRANTTAQLTHAECQSSDYAPGYCNSYSRTNANNQGLTAGKWWLPSEGELMLIYANMNKINAALGKIAGSTQLVRNWYWSSTEYSSANAWVLGLSDGFMDIGTKASDTGHVRPVSAFIS